MALKGLDIFKLSPKKNCKECGSPTCMAFCMKVAQGAVSIDKCPYFSDDAKAVLNEQTAPPMKTITVGNGLKLGGVRAPMPNLACEDEKIVAQAQAMIEAAIAKL